MKYTELIGIIVVLILVGVAAKYLYGPYQDYKTYQEFCDERPDFCYCSKLECEFKTSSSQRCVNGNCSETILSEDTEALCRVAEELNDRKTWFRSDCYLAKPINS